MIRLRSKYFLLVSFIHEVLVITGLSILELYFLLVLFLCGLDRLVKTPEQGSSKSAVYFGSGPYTTYGSPWIAGVVAMGIEELACVVNSIHC